jgi:hypothetical protein
VGNRPSVEKTQAADGSAIVNFSLDDLEAWCQAVKEVMDSASRTGTQMMDMAAAWTYAQSKFPDLYAAAFGDGYGDDMDEASAAKETANIANRIGRLAGKNFNWGWNFVQAELPRVWNRMRPAGDKVLNRYAGLIGRFGTPTAAKVFNRLVRAEKSLAGIPENAASAIIQNRHPGLYGLATDRLSPSEAVKAEPNLSKLLP